MAQNFLIIRPSLDHFKITRYDSQQIIEIMRNSSGKLANRLHFLCLDQSGLGPFAFRYFLHQHIVGARQFARPFGNTGFKIGVEMREPFLSQL